MRKLHKAAVVAATIGSLGFASAGTAYADGDGSWGRNDIGIAQSTHCRSHDLNLDVLGQLGLANGLAGNLLNGEGNSGAQATKLGSTMGCDNSVGK